MAHRGRKNADETLAMALAAGKTLREAAASAGVSERTANRRWADESFRQLVNDLRTEMSGRALGKLADGMAEAADVLRKLLKCKTPSVRLGACRAMLDFGIDRRDLEFKAADAFALLEELNKLRAECAQLKATTQTGGTGGGQTPGGTALPAGGDSQAESGAGAVAP